ncbi:MAG TPA: RidA family protein [Caulobacteraceae bacterium]|jgi:enamine deaminase RidA (YjgF/YER057c/UK114 family)
MVETFTREHMKPLIEPFGLSEAARSGAVLYLGGQVGMDANHQLVAGGLRAQAAQAFRNIAEIIALAGGDTDNILHLTWYLVEDGTGRLFMDDALEVTAARNEVLPGIKPPSTAVRVKALLTPEILIEIQAVAAL